MKRISDFALLEYINLHRENSGDVYLDLADARARTAQLEKQLVKLHKQLRWMVRGWDRCHHNEITHEECVTIGNVRAYLAAWRKLRRKNELAG